MTTIHDTISLPVSELLNYNSSHILREIINLDDSSSIDKWCITNNCIAEFKIINNDNNKLIKFISDPKKENNKDYIVLHFPITQLSYNFLSKLNINDPMKYIIDCYEKYGNNTSFYKMPVYIPNNNTITIKEAVIESTDTDIDTDTDTFETEIKNNLWSIVQVYYDKSFDHKLSNIGIIPNHHTSKYNNYPKVITTKAYRDIYLNNNNMYIVNANEPLFKNMIDEYFINRTLELE